jgi:biotin operon repressor
MGKSLGKTRKRWLDLPEEVRPGRVKIDDPNKDEFGLNPHQREYCELHYVQGKSKEEAYYQAGYQAKPDRVSQAICALERKPAIRRFKFATRQIVAESIGASDQEIIKGLVSIGLKADITEVFESSEAGYLTVRKLNDIPPDTRKSISKIKVQGTKYGVNIEVSMHDRVGALKQLASVMGLDSDINKAVQALRNCGYEVKKTEQGFEVIDLQSGVDSQRLDATINVEALEEGDKDEDEIIQEIISR